MQHQKIHSQGPSLSRIIAGVWKWHTVPYETLERLIHTSIETGITSFDHADIYGNYSCEEVFGSVIRNNSSLKNKIQVITKCGIKLVSDKKDHRIKHYDTTKEHIIASAEQSLKNIGVDKLDVLLIHRPDPLMNPEAIAEAFEILRAQGKVLHVGVSNFTSSQFEMLQKYSSAPLVTNQIEISLFKNESLFDGTIDVLMKHSASPMAWSPLGGGKHFETDAMSRLNEVAENYNSTSSQLLLAWLL
ncbi:MAG: aldo/keto reductase [Flammeovirgaceae bacterium]|nr:aldo/keto reductase [Flammeovirgaceae bacterium]